MKWLAAPICLSVPIPAPTWSGCPPSAATFLTRAWQHTAFISQWVNGLDEYRKSLEPFTLEAAEQACGLSIETLKKVAQMIVEAKGVCILWAMGITQHVDGFGFLHRDLQPAADHRQLHAHRHRRYPLRGHNNVQGAGDQGAAPATLPGYQSVDDPEVRQKFENGLGRQAAQRPRGSIIT